MIFGFTVYGESKPAGSKTTGTTKDGRRFVRDSNPASKEWKRMVAYAAGGAAEGRELVRGPIKVQMDFYRPRPGAHFGKKGVRPSAPPYPITRPDLLKLARAVEDAMTGIIYADDSQIVVEVLTKRFGEPARVDVLISQLPD